MKTIQLRCDGKNSTCPNRATRFIKFSETGTEFWFCDDCLNVGDETPLFFNYGKSFYTKDIERVAK